MRMIIRIILLFSLVCVYIFGKSLTRQVVLLGVVQTHIDKDYVDIIIDMRKPNRKTFMLNITINIFRDLENIQAKAQIYKFVEGRYKQTALKYGGDICHYFKTVCKTLFQFDNLKEVFKNFITECPVKKGKYYVYNVNESIVRAPFIPAWKGKVDYSFSLDNISVYNAVAFFEVVEVSKS